MKRLTLALGVAALGMATSGCKMDGMNNPDGGNPTGQTITLSGRTLDPERATAARTGTLAALFGPADMTGPCWTEPCDNNAAFELSKLDGVQVSVYQHPEIPAVMSKNGEFSLPGVPAKSAVRVVLDKPGDPVYLKTVDAFLLRTGTADLKGLPFHLCRNDKIFKALLDKEGPTALDNGAVLGLVNNNVPLPQNGPLNRDVDASVSAGKLDYVGFDYVNKLFVVDDNVAMANIQNATWLGSILAFGATTPTVKITVLDTEATPDPVTGRPYTYPVVEVPLVPKASTFMLLYPVGTGS